MSKTKPAPLAANTEIGGYRVVRRISAGGFGVVYLALDADDQRVAIKEFLPASLFHEPAWEILLNLYVAHQRGTPLNVKHLVSLVDAPVTTSQRWIDQLVHMKLLNRVVDPADRRRLEISLAPAAVTAVEAYLRALMPPEGDPAG